MSIRLFQQSLRMTIRTKLLVGFCSIIVLLIISALTSLLMNLRVGSLENQISEKNRVLLSCKALSLDVGSAYHNGYLYMMSSFDSDKKRFNALFDQYVPFAILQKADDLDKNIADLKAKSDQAKSLSTWVNMLTMVCSIAFGLLLALQISGSISRSIRQLHQVSGQIANGDLRSGEIKVDTYRSV